MDHINQQCIFVFSLGDYLEKIVSNSTDLLKKQYQEEGFSTEG